MKAVIMKTMKTILLLSVIAAGLQAQALPEGEGKQLVEAQCGSCHGLEQVQAHRDNKDGWQSLVDYMVTRGMASTDAEVKTMVEYLAKSFPIPPKPAADKGKGK
jgi:virginiamycin B lyase